MVNSCSRATSFFRVVQRIYCLFASSPKRWKVLKDNVAGLTVKALSQTRWESRVESIKAIRYQALEIKKTLLDLAALNDDLKSKSEAESLATHGIGNFEFLLGMVIWHNLLFAVNSVSKNFQNEDMQIDVAIDSLKGLVTFMENYQRDAFENAMIEAKEVAYAMGIEPIFQEKRLPCRKKQFDEKNGDEVTRLAEESFRVNYFLYVVDQTLSSLKSMFEQFQEYEKAFGFLFNLNSVISFEDKVLMSSCTNLENHLRSGMLSDIDGRDLFLELKVLKDLLPKEKRKPIDVLNYMITMDGCFPNAWIAYRILLTIPVTVASGERSFSKLKLIKKIISDQPCLKKG